MTSTDIHEVATADGPGRLHVALPEGEATGVVLLGGGHSGQVRTVDLDALAAALPAHGWLVARYELPWRVAGRKVGPRPPASDPAWLAGVAHARATWPGVPLVSGGRSAGARIACRTWTHDLAGILALSFPLHPPGKPEASRVGELAPVGVPVLALSGARDPFGSPDELEVAIADGQAGPRELVVVPGATHSFPSRTAETLVAAVVGWLGRRSV
ncbi:MAG: hydrolase [Propionibacteriaceae bacterium]|nr:hydrolase [Propionibacteriaceae bacterium]